MKTFISHLPVAENLSEYFVTTFEKIVPEWIDSILPYYYEAKRNGDAILHLANFLICGTNPETYVKDGIGYVRTKVKVGTELALNVAQGYRKVNLTEFIPYDPDIMRRSRDFLYYPYHLRRLFNRDEKHRGVKDAIAEYFRDVTGDPDVVLDLGGTTYICWRKDLTFPVD